MNAYTHCCIDMNAAIASSEIPIRFVAKFREYGLDIVDGGSSYREIRFCPWCGRKLPDSLREKWFDLLESQGIDPVETESIPVVYRDSKWYEGW